MFTFLSLILNILLILIIYKFCNREKLINSIISFLQNNELDNNIKNNLDKLDNDIKKLKEVIQDSSIYEEFYKRFKKYRSNIEKDVK